MDTHSLIDALLADGKSVAVPRIVDGTTIHAVTMQGWDDLESGRWGILAPRHDAPTAGPLDAAIVPGVAFTERRDRLGHGRGYYDRWLDENPDAATIALGFELQIVPEIPVEAHDRPVDCLVTEERVLTGAGRSER
ncbi:MAG: 5-formyltetrahydrofolate cyclo-ligase [Ectothiorhodospiraceae bacterium]